MQSGGTWLTAPATPRPLPAVLLGKGKSLGTRRFAAGGDDFYGQQGAAIPARRQLHRLQKCDDRVAVRGGCAGVWGPSQRADGPGADSDCGRIAPGGLFGHVLGTQRICLAGGELSVHGAVPGGDAAYD